MMAYHLKTNIIKKSKPQVLLHTTRRFSAAVVDERALEKNHRRDSLAAVFLRKILLFFDSVYTDRRGKDILYKKVFSKLIDACESFFGKNDVKYDRTN